MSAPLLLSHLLAELKERLPDVLEAVLNGEITLVEAQALLDETSDHPLEVIRASYAACRDAMLSKNPALLDSLPTTVEALEDEVTRHPLAGACFEEGVITLLQMRYASVFTFDQAAIDRCVERSDTRRAAFFEDHERNTLLEQLPVGSRAAFAKTSLAHLRLVVTGGSLSASV